PDYNRLSSANASEPLPNEVTNVSINNRRIIVSQHRLESSAASTTAPAPPPEACDDRSSERNARRHPRKARIQERGRPQPGHAVGRDDVLNRIAVQCVVEVERQPQPAPADVDHLV